MAAENTLRGPKGRFISKKTAPVETVETVNSTDTTETDVSDNSSTTEENPIENGDDVTTVTPGNVYVHGFTEVEGDDDDLSEDEIIDTILDPMEEIPDIDFMTNYLLSHELDEAKKEKFNRYIRQLDKIELRAMWEAFKASYGNSPAVVTAIQNAKDLIQSVETSRSLTMRNNAAHAELSRMGTVYAQLERSLRNVSDTPIASLSVENISAYIAKLHRDLTTLNSAILEMAEMLTVGVADGDAVDMAINPDRAAKICAVVGYSAKAWANVYDKAASERASFTSEIETLKQHLKTANEAVANAQATAEQERKQLQERVLRADRYAIRNNSGFFITTTNVQTAENEEYFRISPFNLKITTDESEALTFDDIDIARKVFDALQVWIKRNINVRRKFKVAGVNPDTMFIAAESMVKVD